MDLTGRYRKNQQRTDKSEHTNRNAQRIHELESLMRKLDASSRAEAVFRSMRLRLFAPYRI